MKIKFSKMFSKIMVVMVAVVMFGGVGNAVLAQQIPDPFVFSLSNPSNISVSQGQSKTTIINLSSLTGTNGVVTLSKSIGGNPSGLSISLNSTSGTTPFSSTATITATAGATLGTFLVTVTGQTPRNGYCTWSGHDPDFGGWKTLIECHASSGTLNWSYQVNKNDNTSYSHIVESRYLDGGITECSNGFAWTTAEMGDFVNTSRWACFEDNDIKTTTFNVTVSSPGSFDYSLSNGGNRYITPGSTVTNPINSTLVLGTTAPVKLYISSIKNSSNVEVFNTANGIGTTSNALSVNPVTPTQSSDLTLTATAGVPAGVYTVTVNGIGNSVAHTTSYTVTVDPYNLTVTTPTSSCTGGVTNLTWNRLNGATSYTVYRSTGGGSAVIITSVAQPASGLTASTTDSGLQSGVAYTYTIVSNVGSSQPITGFSSVADPALCSNNGPRCTIDPVVTGNNIAVNYTIYNDQNSVYTLTSSPNISVNSSPYTSVFNDRRFVPGTYTYTLTRSGGTTCSNSATIVNTLLTKKVQLWPDTPSHDKPLNDDAMNNQPPLKVREGQDVKVNYTWTLTSPTCTGFIVSAPNGWADTTDGKDWLKNKSLSNGLGFSKFTNLSKGTYKIKLRCLDIFGFKEHSSVLAKISNFIFSIAQAASTIESNDVTIIVTKSSIQEF